MTGHSGAKSRAESRYDRFEEELERRRAEQARTEAALERIAAQALRQHDAQRRSALPRPADPERGGRGYLEHGGHFNGISPGVPIPPRRPNVPPPIPPRRPNVLPSTSGDPAVSARLPGNPPTPSNLPVDPRFVISSPFGMRKDPKTGQPAMHSGLDFATPTGTPVVATIEGKVVVAGPKNNFGNTVVVQGRDGYHTTFAHLSGIHVTPGMHVTPGTILGLSGNTGRSFGPHLHYEVSIGGWGKGTHRIDPRAFHGLEADHPIK